MFFMFLKHMSNFMPINRMLFTIRSINIFFMSNFRLKNLKFKHLIDDIIINFLSYFASIEDIRKKCNPILDLSKFTFNKNILSEVVTLIYNTISLQVCC